MTEEEKKISSESMEVQANNEINENIENNHDNKFVDLPRMKRGFEDSPEVGSAKAQKLNDLLTPNKRHRKENDDQDKHESVAKDNALVTLLELNNYSMTPIKNNQKHQSVKVEDIADSLCKEYQIDKESEREIISNVQDAIRKHGKYPIKVLVLMEIYKRKQINLLYGHKHVHEYIPLNEYFDMVSKIMDILSLEKGELFVQYENISELYKKYKKMVPETQEAFQLGWKIFLKKVERLSDLQSMDSILMSVLRYIDTKYQLHMDIPVEGVAETSIEAEFNAEFVAGVFWNFEVPFWDKTINSAMKSAATRNLNRDFEKYDTMCSTPISAKSIQIKALNNYVTDFPTSKERILIIIKESEELKLDNEKAETTIANLANILSSYQNIPQEITLKLFNHILMKMILMEKERLKEKKNVKEILENWIEDETFLKSLFCCSIEIVRYSFQIQDITFENLLDSFSVKAFDLLMVVESVVRSEPRVKFTWLIVRRLKEIEERIIESEVFRDQDPLFKSKEEQENYESDEEIINNALQVLSKENPVIFGEFNAEIKASTTSNRKLTRLEFFYRKLFRLAHLRLNNFVTKLDISKDLYSKIWDVFIYCIKKEKELLFGRHLDQLIICSLYAVCKIHDNEKLFRDIVKVYKQEPQFLELTYKCIKDDTGTSSMDLIKFYNKCYLPKMRAAIHSIKKTDEDRTNESSTTNETPEVSMPLKPSHIFIPQSPIPKYRDFSSPRNITSQIFVSPMKSSKSHQMNFTPMTRKLYSFGESPSKVNLLLSTSNIKDLNEINEQISSKTKSQRKLNFA